MAEGPSEASAAVVSGSGEANDRPVEPHSSGSNSVSNEKKKKNLSDMERRAVYEYLLLKVKDPSGPDKLVKGAFAASQEDADRQSAAGDSCQVAVFMARQILQYYPD
jgi:hypothetical protein